MKLKCYKTHRQTAKSGGSGGRSPPPEVPVGKGNRGILFSGGPLWLCGPSETRLSAACDFSGKHVCPLSCLWLQQEAN